MPTLYVLGGANGVGKTTWYDTLKESGRIDSSLPFINSDNIQRELGSYSLENSIKAEEIVRNHMRELISQKRDFTIESNLAKTADYEWINLMRKQGYQTSLFFLCTGDVEANKQRVIQRVMEGGHGIPEPIIEQRYRMGLSYISKEQNAPQWVIEVLFLAERLQQKQQLSNHELKRDGQEEAGKHGLSQRRSIEDKDRGLSQ